MLTTGMTTVLLLAMFMGRILLPVFGLVLLGTWVERRQGRFVPRH